MLNLKDYEVLDDPVSTPVPSTCVGMLEFAFQRDGVRYDKVHGPSISELKHRRRLQGYEPKSVWDAIHPMDPDFNLVYGKDSQWYGDYGPRITCRIPTEDMVAIVDELFSDPPEGWVRLENEEVEWAASVTSDIDDEADI